LREELCGKPSAYAASDIAAIAIPGSSALASRPSNATKTEKTQIMPNSERNRANVIDSQVGARLRERRKSLKLTQSQLGKHLGISFQQIQKYEAGTNRIGASNLYKLAAALNVPVQHFFQDVFQDNQVVSDEENDGQLRSILAFVRTVEGRDLFSAFLNISNPGAKKHVIELIKAMSGDKPDKR
jgi:transcriptional regulator with XRE-family HTH domain